MPVDLDEALVAFGDRQRFQGPSVRELQAALGLPSSETAQRRLRMLAELEFIERESGGLARGWRLTGKGRAAYAELRRRG